MAETEPQQVTFSFVCPVYNEQEGLDAFYKRLAPVAAKLGEPYEIIFVNDGSTDDTAGVIRRLAAADNSIRYVEFSRNFGHQVAITAGCDYSAGQAVICMDADCQHPPEMVTELVARWREGFEIVNAVPEDAAELSRAGRGLTTRFLSALGFMTQADLEDQTDFRLMDYRAVQALRQAREHSRCVRGLVNWIGFRQITVPYKGPKPARNGRRFGSVRDTGMFNFSSRPLRIAPVVGVVLLAIVAVYALASLVLLPFGRGPSGMAHLAMAIVALFGTQFLLMGLLGEYVARIFEESKNRPLYVVREAIGFEPPSSKAQAEPVQTQQERPPKRFVLYT